MTTSTEPITSAATRLYLPKTLLDSVKELAREADRPVSREIRAALREHVERHREGAGED
ncbi:MAG TPA: ribbon-helix-helix protein, CopG family [Solirubrobacteraceae bacterium]